MESVDEEDTVQNLPDPDAGTSGGAAAARRKRYDICGSRREACGVCAANGTFQFVGQSMRLWQRPFQKALACNSHAEPFYRQPTRTRESSRRFNELQS